FGRRLHPKVGQYCMPIHNVIYLGSHDGCSCGFFGEDNDEPEDKNQRNEDTKRLSKYLHESLEIGANLEMFLCWQGGEIEPQVTRKQLTPKDFLTTEFPLKENEFATIVSTAN
ncbi:hypothetical protein, partial [Trichlorobacter lovleyi]|uniref:hypothetical protein n=1 Tax=Trichlorobacter lovleyi TaxID=313985 RepID=UPI003D126884